MTGAGPLWDTRAAPGGGYDLRAAQRNRGCLVAGASLIALGWVGSMVAAIVTHRALPLGVGPSVAIAIGTIAFAVWCARADEVWHVAANHLEHRVGIGRLGRTRSYRAAAVEVLVHSNQWGKAFGRLYITDSSGRHFLFERDVDDASGVADFICSATGWPRRDLPLGSGF